MNQNDKHMKIIEYIKQGEEISVKECLHSETSNHSKIRGPLYEKWMNEINIFNERHLKDHPLYSNIHMAFLYHNTDQNCFSNMMGYLHVLENDSEYWQLTKKDANNTSSTNFDEQKTNKEIKPVIFISHRTTDAMVASFLKDYLVGMGIPNEYIFCSSLPGNDVKQVISREIKTKLLNSSVNIVLLSNDYYKSAYCLSEAGIIWFLDPKTPAIIIGLPEISISDMCGFLNNDYKLRRLDNIQDISDMYEIIKNSVGASTINITVAVAEGQKFVKRYKEYINSKNITIQEATQKSNICEAIESITTDDERVVLYYILIKKKRHIKKADLIDWISDNEIYEIDAENALDLLSNVGTSSYNNETLELDICYFKKITAEAEKIISILKPIVLKYQKLSSSNFIKMWNSNQFSDNQKLFIAYLIQKKIYKLGARWMEDKQKRSIRQWELENNLNCSIENSYGPILNLFIENHFVYESDWTSYQNAREYTLFPSLKNLLSQKNFPFAKELDTIITANKKLVF